MQHCQVDRLANQGVFKASTSILLGTLVIGFPSSESLIPQARPLQYETVERRLTANRGLAITASQVVFS